jgi:hypothetical protein
MATAPNNIAVIFDFDDTLTDESTTKLLEHYGIDAKKFWLTQNKELIQTQGWDPVPAYMKLMLDNVLVVNTCSTSNSWRVSLCANRQIYTRADHCPVSSPCVPL